MFEQRSYRSLFSRIQHGVGYMGRLPTIANSLALADAKTKENWYQRYFRSWRRVNLAC